MEDFGNWCLVRGGKAGDVGLVKTELGDHVFFFSGRGEEIWLTQTRQAYLGQQQTAILEEALARYDMKVSYGKIALISVDLG